MTACLAEMLQERRGNGPAAQCVGANPSAPNLGRRLVRPRRKGYRTPEGVQYGGRPGPLQNPFERRLIRPPRLYAFGQARAFKLHSRWLPGELGALSLERLGFSIAEIDALARMRHRVLAMLPALRGRDIECWCPLSSRWCHVDTIIRMTGGARGGGK